MWQSKFSLTKNSRFFYEYVYDCHFNKQVELETTTKEPGTPLRAPTVEGGLVTACQDTCYGDLKLQMWERRYEGSKGKVCT